MDTFEAAKIAVPALMTFFLGSMAATVVGIYRARRQPVGRSIEMVPVLYPRPADSTLKAYVTIEEQGKKHELPNLYAYNVRVVNNGNRDLDKFVFGISAIEKSDQVVFAEARGADKHHVVTVSPSPAPSAPVSELDFVCTPFNRADTYTFRVFVVAHSGHEPQGFEFATPAPVVWGSIVTNAEIASIIAETLGKAALNTIIRYR